MSLYRRFKPVEGRILLPEPRSYEKSLDQDACTAANSLVEQCLKQDSNQCKRKETYTTYDETTRAKITRLALEQGNTAAANKMAMNL